MNQIDFWHLNINKNSLLFSILSLFLFSCDQQDMRLKHQKKPNVIILLADDLGHGDISCYGQKNYQTPNIDNLAAHGVKCTDFYVPTPYCAPSRATLLTGRFPLRHHLILNPTPGGKNDSIGLNTNEITLGKIFKEAGYKTKAIGKWHLGHKEKFFPIHQGFDEYYGILYSNDMRPVQLIKDEDTIEYPVDQNFLTQKYTKRAKEFISRVQDKPFFLYMSYSVPHKPLAVSSNFYSPETPNDLYEDVVKELDWSVGEVMSTLKELKLLSNTIVIFMSDNGPWYGGSTGGLKGMKATTWEGGIRVPFIIRYPKVFPENKIVDTPCWSPDILPTLLSLTNIKPNKQRLLDGINITKIIQGKQGTHPSIFSLRNSSIMSVRKGDFKLFLKKPHYILRDKNWIDKSAPDGKTIIARPNQPGVSQFPGLIPQKTIGNYQLFNIKLDSIESTNLVHKYPSKTKELIQEYKAFKHSLLKK